MIKNSAIVIEGKLCMHNNIIFNSEIKKMEGKQVNITISAKKKGRSNPQNNYYWGIVIKTISDELGYTSEEVHDVLRLKFLTDRTQKVWKFGSTTKLNTKQFEEYIEEVRRWASSFLNIYIPNPNEWDC